jgi:hypothetical protein
MLVYFVCLLTLTGPTVLFSFISTLKPSLVSAKNMYRRESDGLIISYDPYAPEMIEKYGAPGETDNEGFNPYADTVGPGIYGGRVQRDSEGRIIIGEQYQNHNPRPGPVYAGGGYTPMSKALQTGTEIAVASLLDKYPDLVNEVTTGGASPLHMCGMSRKAQVLAAYIISRGGDVESVDTYGYRPLHRMASNNLAVGAEALLRAGADPRARASSGSRGETPMQIARSAGAGDVIVVLQKYL